MWVGLSWLLFFLYPHYLGRCTAMIHHLLWGWLQTSFFELQFSVFTFPWNTSPGLSSFDGRLSKYAQNWTYYLTLRWTALPNSPILVIGTPGILDAWPRDHDYIWRDLPLPSLLSSLSLSHRINLPLYMLLKSPPAFSFHGCDLIWGLLPLCQHCHKPCWLPPLLSDTCSLQRSYIWPGDSTAQDLTVAAYCLTKAFHLFGWVVSVHF